MEFGRKCRTWLRTSTSTRAGARDRPVAFTEAVVERAWRREAGCTCPSAFPRSPWKTSLALADLPYAQRAATHLPGVRHRPARRRDRRRPDGACLWRTTSTTSAICPITSLDDADPRAGAVARPHQRLQGHGAAMPAAVLLRQRGRPARRAGSWTTSSSSWWPPRATRARPHWKGFKDADGVRIGVLFPDGGVSDIQRKQMVTQHGRQRAGVGRARQLRRLPDRRQERVFRRRVRQNACLPRRAWRCPAPTPSTGDASCRRSSTTCPPTPNWWPQGKVEAGDAHRRVRAHRKLRQHPGRLVRARRMGTPIDMLMCASNENRVLTDFINTGTYDIADRPFVLTPSSVHGHPGVVEPGAAAVRAHGTRRAGHRAAGWTTCVRERTLPRGPRDVRRTCAPPSRPTPSTTPRAWPPSRPCSTSTTT